MLQVDWQCPSTPKLNAPNSFPVCDESDDYGPQEPDY